ncbi:hypothetical protein EU527_16160 [Candidatus Thorarchaeota archaeon]|nr:MAG: hypothetical protein EU527_16160 [Candidatus Thorarchaeota archaeon]
MCAYQLDFGIKLLLFSLGGAILIYVASSMVLSAAFVIAGDSIGMPSDIYMMNSSIINASFGFFGFILMFIGLKAKEPSQNDNIEALAV